METSPNEHFDPSLYSFTAPNIESERGEIERVAETFSQEHPEEFTNSFIAAAKNTPLTSLTEEMWSTLENSDSFDIPKNGWQQVTEQVDHVNNTTGSHRNWENLRSKIEAGQELDAPIILKHENTLHLVSGNTRLMVARALGIKPKALIVEM